MKYKGTISEVTGQHAWGTVYDDEDNPKAFSLPVPDGYRDFSIIPDSEVYLLDGEDATQDDGAITPVFIIIRRDKALVLVTTETEAGLDVLSGNIIDKTMLGQL